MKLAGVVILYNPDEKVLANITSYSTALDRIYILDNSESAAKDFSNQLNQIPNGVYVQYQNNAGIALRLNEAADMARKENFTHLLTMDQDSSFGAGVFREYIIKTNNYLKDHDNVGVFAVNFQPRFIPVEEQPKEVLSTITSGSIIDLDIHQQVGGYDNDLFLDLVDADYCYRVNLAGFKTVLFPGIILNHIIGYHVWGRSLKNFKLTRRKIHPPVRLYYLVRNSLFLLNKRPLPEGAKQEIKKSLWLLKNNLIYNKRWQVIKYMVKAYIDYKNNKMGKIQS
ncbi:glycosyltransferase family protein [Niabella aquatica]